MKGGKRRKEIEDIQKKGDKSPDRWREGERQFEGGAR